MKKIILVLVLISFLSCNDNSGEGQYYSHAKWKKFRKEYDLGFLRDKPLEVKEDVYINLNDTTINTEGEANGFEKFKFNAEGEMVFWQLSKKDSQWVIGEMNYDKNGFQARYYSNKDSLKTFQNVSKIISTRLAKDRYLMHSFFNIGPAFILISNQNGGDIVKKEYLTDSTKLKDVVKTIIYYYQKDAIQKIETSTRDGYYDVENYYYSKQGSLDSIHKLIRGKIAEKELFVNNQYGDPVKYNVIRVPQNDTFTNIKLDYIYDSHRNWIKRLENRISGNYPVSSKNVNYTLVSREIRY